jgi:hypothetical protein
VIAGIEFQDRFRKTAQHLFDERSHRGTKYGPTPIRWDKLLICLYKWRRWRDSNPRSPVRGTTLFETARSTTSAIPLPRQRTVP